MNDRTRVRTVAELIDALMSAPVDDTSLVKIAPFNNDDPKGCEAVIEIGGDRVVWIDAASEED